ncbi:Cupin 4 family protein [Leptothrix cholodnii SP-6]|uniref:Cupin 4 family protein n=1 Tax=Leptothrix cholodnii (strain ATCC 51168 / LMG 8142 / SP-6) TaxID=395495 RepID=B1Y837_LEPCP|nr:cupin domain-containing protein [Leptothrix cholodnii]ACB34907.1 Cupin 4 family protein [Leptothrix cholodnii SP-6]
MNLPKSRAASAAAQPAKPSVTKGSTPSPVHPDAAVPPLDLPCELLGGLSPSVFMQRHWQRKPLLVRQAVPGIEPPVSRAQMFAMLEDDAVESRFLSRQGEGDRQTWQFKRGPMPRRSLPAIKQPGWTVLVQGLNLHVPAAADLLNRFRFVPQARLDDLMISWASEGGGVGPHFDSYDVFLIQVAGRRRWRIGRLPDARLREGLPVKIIENFRHEEEWVLEPGDMLYLPPGWAHDGDAVDGECMTCSVGFRSPQRSELVRETLLRLADGIDDPADAGARPPVYRDPKQSATAAPGRIPAELLAFAEQGLMRALAEPGALARALGEYLSEPKAQVSFELGEPLPDGVGVRLDDRSCLLYDDGHVYCNGDSWRAAGRDAAMLHLLADARQLDATTLRRASPALRALLEQWADDGWLHPLAG